MSTARNRFGVSILVALVLGVLLTATPASASARGAASDSGQPAISVSPSDVQLFGAVGEIASAASGRTQTAIALGAGVPLLIIGTMVRRRIYADV